jgi:endonuclease/exonuclease/phosphatase family metal-dependent hydrolase
MVLENQWRELVVLVLLLVVTPSASGEDVFSIPAGERIVIGTWNLKWLFDENKNDNASDLAKEMSAASRAVYEARVRRMAVVIAGIHPTVMALQEVENKKVARDLADALRVHHQLNYKVGFVQGTDSYTEQDVAFLVEERVGDFVVGGINPRLEKLDDRDRYKIPSKHAVLLLTTKVGEELGTLTVITAHLKAGDDERDEAQRILQSRALNAYAARLVRDRHEVIMLGDFNAGQPYRNTSRRDGMGVLVGMETEDESDDFADLDRALPVNWRQTHSGGGQLDRIVVSGDLLDREGLVLERIFNHRNQMPRGLSDHSPLTVRFRARPR